MNNQISNLRNSLNEVLDTSVNGRIVRDGIPQSVALRAQAALMDTEILWAITGLPQEDYDALVGDAMQYRALDVRTKERLSEEIKQWRDQQTRERINDELADPRNRG